MTMNKGQAKQQISIFTREAILDIDRALLSLSNAKSALRKSDKTSADLVAARGSLDSASASIDEALKKVPMNLPVGTD